MKRIITKNHNDYHQPIANPDLNHGNLRSLTLAVAMAFGWNADVHEYNSTYTCAVPEHENPFLFQNDLDLVAGHPWLEERRIPIFDSFSLAVLNENYNGDTPLGVVGHCRGHTSQWFGLRKNYFVVDAFPTSMTGERYHLAPDISFSFQ